MSCFIDDQADCSDISEDELSYHNPYASDQEGPRREEAEALLSLREPSTELPELTAEIGETKWEDPGNPDDDLPSGMVHDVSTKGRVNAKWVFLTYPGLGNQRPEFEEWKSFFEAKGATAGIIGRERHRNGTWHIHCILEKVTKWDCGMRAFDFKGFHPNIRTIRPGKFEGVEEYCCKDGDFIKWHIRDIPASSKNYLKRKADKGAWLADIQNSRYSSPPDRILLPDGTTFELSGARTKKRGVVIVGPASTGKTTWLLHELRGARYYQVRNERNPWDGWTSDTRVVVWNDVGWWPTKDDLTFFTDLGIKYHQGGYLRARFFDRWAQPGVYTMIILCNNEDYEKCPYSTYPWFKERFRIIYLTDSWECQGSDCDC